MLTTGMHARVGRYLYWLVTVLFALGLMAKPQIVTLPFVLLLWDYWPLERMGARVSARQRAHLRLPLHARSRYLVWEKLPLFVLAAADSVVTVLAQRAGNSVRTLAEVPVSVRLENVFVSYVRYIGKAFWPVPSRSLVSTSREFAARLAGGGSGGAAAPGVGARAALARPPLSAGRLVLVSGNFSSDDRHCHGRRAGDGRPLRLHPLHRFVCRRRVGPGRAGLQRCIPGRVARRCRPSRGLASWMPHLSPTRLTGTTMKPSGAIP